MSRSPVRRLSIAIATALMATVAGDLMASGDCSGAQNCVSPVLGPQLVKLSYIGYVHGEQYVGLIGGSGFLHASVFTVPASGTKQITVRMTQLDH